MCVCVFYVVYECDTCMYACAPRGREELVRTPVTGVTGSCELSCDCWEVQLLCRNNRTSCLLGHPSPAVATALVFIYYYCVRARMGPCGGQRTTLASGISSPCTPPWVLGIRPRLPGTHGKHLDLLARNAVVFMPSLPLSLPP